MKKACFFGIIFHRIAKTGLMMHKYERHHLIKEMIRRSRIATQKEIQNRLEAQGVEVTQTTLSRDLRELGLIKARSEGHSYYVLPDRKETADFIKHVMGYIQRVERASFTLVLHTRLGEAGVASNIIDGERPQQILGTIAGADTLLVICRDEAAASQLEAELKAGQTEQE